MPKQRHHHNYRLVIKFYFGKTKPQEHEHIIIDNSQNNDDSNGADDATTPKDDSSTQKFNSFLNELDLLLNTKPFLNQRVHEIMMCDEFTITDSFGTQLIQKFKDKEISKKCRLTFIDAQLSLNALLYFFSKHEKKNNQQQDERNTSIPDNFDFGLENCLLVDGPRISITGTDIIRTVAIANIKMDKTEANRLIEDILMKLSSISIGTIQLIDVTLSFDAFNWLSSNVVIFKHCQHVIYEDCYLFVENEQEGKDNLKNDNNNEPEQQQQRSFEGSMSNFDNRYSLVGFDIDATTVKLYTPIIKEIVKSQQYKNLYFQDVKFSIESLQMIFSSIFVNDTTNNNDDDNDSSSLTKPKIIFESNSLFLEQENVDDMILSYTNLPRLEWEIENKNCELSIQYSAGYTEQSNHALEKVLLEFSSFFKGVVTLTIEGYQAPNDFFPQLLQTFQNNKIQSSMTIKGLYLHSPMIDDACMIHLAKELDSKKWILTHLLHVDIAGPCNVSKSTVWRLVETLKTNYYLSLDYDQDTSSDDDDDDEISVDNNEDEPLLFDELLEENLQYYSTLNKIGRCHLLSKSSNQISPLLFAIIFKKAKQNHSVMYWLLRTLFFPHFVFFINSQQQLAGQKRKA